MAKKDEVKEKVDTPVLGAEGSTDLEKETVKTDEGKNAESEDKEKADTANQDGAGSGEGLEDDEFDAPEWVVALLESNQAVIDSNNELIESIEDLKSFSKGEKSELSRESVGANPDVKLNKKAKYVVREGKKFVDIDNPSISYAGGDDVSKLKDDRLLNLLSQGIIEESKA